MSTKKGYTGNLTTNPRGAAAGYLRGIANALVGALVSALRRGRSRSVSPRVVNRAAGAIGLPYLTRGHGGEMRCVACFLCSAACPSHCISMEAAENSEGSEVRRLPDRFDLDSARCILCGFCVQACPHGAIAMGEGVALPIASTAEQLLGNEQTLLLTRQA